MLDEKNINQMKDPVEVSNQHTIILNRLFHNKKQQIGMVFPYNEEMIRVLKSIPGATWTRTHRCWYIENNPANLRKIFEAFKGKAWVDAKELFEKKKETEIEPTIPTKKYRLKGEITSDTKEKLEKLKQWMKSKRYSESTIKTYTLSLQTFFRFYHDKNAEEIEHSDIIRFNTDYILATAIRKHCKTRL